MAACTFRYVYWRGCFKSRSRRCATLLRPSACGKQIFSSASSIAPQQQQHQQQQHQQHHHSRKISRLFSSVTNTTPPQDNDKDKYDYPLLIVGGGPSGLFLANLLQRYKVDFVLLEAQNVQDHFQHPQAHFLNTRTMEILKRFAPLIYERVLNAMAPVKEWNRFLFGPSMTHSPMMATVQHPVHAPLVANSNSNGVLLLDNEEEDCISFDADDSQDAIPLSDCSVGHLAQHTFSRILYEEVQRNLSPNSSLEFGSRVIQAQHVDDSHCWQVTTDTGKVYKVPFVVAADGAKSTWRQEYLKIGMSGQPEIQRLINVHFTLTNPPNNADDLPPAMLYTVFSSKVLAMVVRHGPTDYVMQIPYFPPYQTVEDDFSQHQVEEMVQAALGAKLEFQIRSIRPWTMGSLVAESYGQDNVFLVGDAAHVFPPAGGFGMNTGLQDVLSLAWRLKLLVDGHYHRSLDDNDRSSDAVAAIYTQERQPVAHNNAALSVRNYHRVLGVMKSCYLDERNLPILLKTLETSAQLGMPLSWQRATFQNLFRTALLPLQMLKDSPGSPYSRHVTNNLRRLLQSGQGLPLLFPNHELSFSYPRTSSSGPQTAEDPMIEKSLDWSQDTIAGAPAVLMSGRLFPHFPCRWIAGSQQKTKQPALLLTTTRDLPAQLATSEQPCPFCLLIICSTSREGGGNDSSFSSSNKHSNKEAVERMSAELEELMGGIAVIPALLEIGSDDDDDDDTINESSLVKSTSSISSCETEDASIVISLRTSMQEWKRRKLVLLDGTTGSSWHFDADGPLLVLIRPDGHVVGIGWEEIRALHHQRYY